MNDGKSSSLARSSGNPHSPKGRFRFVWQTNASGQFHFPEIHEAITGLYRTLSGKAWPHRDAIGDALQSQETFVGVEATLSLDGIASVDVTLSGTPITADDHRFDGYRGFGFIKNATVATAIPVEKSVIKAVEARPVNMPWSTANGLSENERNAFREIARALGARQTDIEDETPAVAVVSEAPIVAPFEPALEQGAHPDRLMEVLDRLPLGILISRGGVPILMNQPLLDWLGYESADAFFETGGIDTMFGGRDPSRRAVEDDGAMLLRRRDGDMVALGVKLQTVKWDDLPASMMIFEQIAPSRQEFVPFDDEMGSTGTGVSAGELSAILDTATDGVIILDNNGRILSLNRSAEALFGMDTITISGEHFTTLLAENSRNRALDYLEGLKDNGVASVLNDGREVTGQTQDGGQIPLFMTMGRISTSSVPKFCAVLRDITAFKRAERDFIEARRAAETASARKSDFLARMSHEIRTPLSAIIGFAEIMQDERFGALGNTKYRDYVQDILKSGAHVLNLVNDLLDLSKIEAGRADLTFVEVDVNMLLLEAANTVQETANKAQVILRTSLASHMPAIVADERSLTQIMLNILSNAIKFTPAGGQVIISTTRSRDGEVIIRVKDTGVGMSEADIAMALEPFRQVTTTRRAGGTGLGLPLTKALIEANRASMAIRSARYSGTVVEITFPPTRVLADR
jgi:PAS domain S-box-containing protein